MLKAILIAGAALAASLGATAANAQLNGNAISVAYNFPALGTDYYNYSASPSTFTVGSGIESTVTVDGLPISIDFANSSLTLTAPSVSWSSSAFNGLVFTNNSGVFSSILSATGIDPSRISVTGNQLAINWNGMSFNSGDTVFLSFASGGVPEPATWALMILGFGAIGFAMRRAKIRSDVRFDEKIKRIAAGADA